MESVLKIGPAVAVAALNIWLLWFAATSYTAVGAGSAQADFDLAHYLLRFGVPVFFFGGVLTRDDEKCLDCPS